ncbi:unnamed protein product [Mytilus coruscus]|uniref:Uncharacterized protein n=1 Tax=Mytilus coruscus TaxID=42192 RepID=A0A6J8B2J9_MYTCO|nr:unnamed protein product [Mytilus coruscus]
MRLAKHAYQPHSVSEREIKILEIQDKSNKIEHDDSLETVPKQIEASEALDNTETEIFLVCESDNSIDFVDSHVRDPIFENNITVQLNKDVLHVAKQVKNLHEKLDQVCKIQDTNDQLLNEITHSKTALKLEQQEKKLIKEEIVVQNIKIKNQKEEIITLKSDLTKCGDRPLFIKMSDSTKITTPNIQYCMPNIHANKFSDSPIAYKRKELKLSLNEHGQYGKNILINRISITIGIQIRILKQEVNVNTNRGGTVESIKRHISSIDFSPHTTLILQFGGKRRWK